MFGGEQEFGLRPGTENVALALELAKALEKLKT
jgi:cysteine sulfinate desulfinase/cysteine desulfurase-like protein